MLPLFAQFNQPPAGGAAGRPPDPAALAGVLACYGVLIVVGLVVQILFLSAMSRCLREVSPRNRQMTPGQVWLCLIPLFGFVWTIIMVIRVADSLRDEFDDRRLRGDGDYGKTLGIAYVVTALLCGLVGLICWIMYWVKIAGYTRQLADDGGYDRDDDDRPRPRRRSRRDEYDDDDDDDERPRSRRRDDDYDDDDDDRPRRR